MISSRKTFLVDGRGVDIDAINPSDLSVDDWYYEVSAPGVNDRLVYSAPQDCHRQVLSAALIKWLELGSVNREFALFPENKIKELSVANILRGI